MLGVFDEGKWTLGNISFQAEMCLTIMMIGLQMFHLPLAL